MHAYSAEVGLVSKIDTFLSKWAVAELTVAIFKPFFTWVDPAAQQDIIKKTAPMLGILEFWRTHIPPVWSLEEISAKPLSVTTNMAVRA